MCPYPFPYEREIKNEAVETIYSTCYNKSIFLPESLSVT